MYLILSYRSRKIYKYGGGSKGPYSSSFVYLSQLNSLPIPQNPQVTMLITESHSDVSTETGSMRMFEDHGNFIDTVKNLQVSSFTIPQSPTILKPAFPPSSSSPRYTR